jgi:putative transposase
VLLAFGDLVETFGIPDYCYLDNGRSFASKWLTGRTPNRYRFKVKDEDPAGILTQLGVEVHWTTPYAGQSKPIERAFGDFARGIAKHPRFAGAWTGNNPMGKPENYASKAVPLDVFIQTVAEGIIEHNARIGRKARVCAGRSFVETFSESYAKSPIRKATAEQQRLWLMAAEAIGVSRQDGSVAVGGNTFWSEFLLDHRGKKVTVRFDPQDLQDRVYVYRLDGAYLGAAPCTAAGGFNSVEDAQAHNRKRNAFLRATRDLMKAELSMSIRDVAALLPSPIEPAPLPATKIVRLTHGNTALQPIPMPVREEEEDPREAAAMDALAQMNAARRGSAHLRVVNEEDAGD